MRNPHLSSLNVWRLLLWSLTSLLILSIALCAVFLVLGWFSGSLQIPLFLLPSQSGNLPTRLFIDVQPGDATITLNDRPYNREETPIPGDYTVRVTRDGFYSVEETFRVHLNQENHLRIHLMPIIKIQELTHYATAPGWDDQGNLYFLDGSEGKIYKWNNNTLSATVDTVEGTYQLIYLPTGTHAFALAVEGPEGESRLHMINLQTGDITDFQGAGFVSLGSDGRTVWGFNYDSADNIEKPVWSLELDGPPKLLSLDNSQWATYGDQLLVDPSGQWLAIESSKGIAIWEITSGKLVTTFENAFTPVWVQNPEPGLAFLNADHSLNFARAELNWSPIVLLSNVQTPVASMPGGSEIVFTRYNPFVGGASFWAVDTATMGVRLLSESKTESGKVEEFALSLDGKKIAFVNQKNVLFLVTLEP